MLKTEKSSSREVHHKPDTHQKTKEPLVWVVKTGQNCTSRRYSILINVNRSDAGRI